MARRTSSYPSLAGLGFVALVLSGLLAHGQPAEATLSQDDLKGLLPPGARISTKWHQDQVAVVGTPLASSTTWVVLYDLQDINDPSVTIYDHAIAIVREDRRGFRIVTSREIEHPEEWPNLAVNLRRGYPKTIDGRNAATLIAVEQTLIRGGGMGTELIVYSWDGTKLRRVFRSIEFVAYIWEIPSQSTDTLTLKLLRGQMRGNRNVPDVYVIDSRRAHLANKEHPELYREYADRADAVVQRREHIDYREFLRILRALNSLQEYDKSLAVSEIGLDSVGRPDTHDARTVKGVYTELALQPLYVARGDAWLGKGNEAKAVEEYTTAGGVFEFTARAGEAMESRLRNSGRTEEQKYWSDSVTRGKVDAEGAGRGRQGPPSARSQGFAWRYLGDEYARRLDFRAARRAYGRSLAILGPVDEAWYARARKTHGDSSMSAKEYGDKYQRANIAHDVQRTLKWLIVHEPD